jgi:hypothetical protein
MSSEEVNGEAKGAMMYGGYEESIGRCRIIDESRECHEL